MTVARNVRCSTFLWLLGQTIGIGYGESIPWTFAPPNVSASIEARQGSWFQSSDGVMRWLNQNQRTQRSESVPAPLCTLQPLPKTGID